MVDEQKLRQLAEAATPGHWDHWQSGGIHQIDAATKTVVHWSGFDQLQTPNEKNAIKDNAAYIAAANPAAIIALLDELQTLREERTEWRVTAENAEKDAERYRWLLANYARGDGYDAIDRALNDGEPDTQLSPAIDAAIDAAMKDES